MEASETSPVEKLLTSKTFSRWRHCVDYYNQAMFTADMMQVLENGDLKLPATEVSSALKSLTSLSCVFFTQNCIRQEFFDYFIKQHVL